MPRRTVVEVLAFVPNAWRSMEPFLALLAARSRPRPGDLRVGIRAPPGNRRALFAPRESRMRSQRCGHEALRGASCRGRMRPDPERPSVHALLRGAAYP